MRKLYIMILFLTSLLLSSCGAKKENKIDDKKISIQLNEKTKLINVDKKLEKLKKELVKMWFTGEKLNSILKEQKISYEIIANLKADARKKYIFENEVLPAIVSDKNITPENVKYCHTTDINAYAQCMRIKNIPLKKVLEKTPKQLQDIVKKAYYTEFYTVNKNLLQKTTDPIAIEIKKQKIKDMINNNIITKASVCNQLPEKKVQDYCKSLINKK